MTPLLKIAACMYCGQQLDRRQHRCSKCDSEFDPEDLDTYYSPFIHGPVRMRPGQHCSLPFLIGGLMLFAGVLLYAADHFALRMFIDFPGFCIATTLTFCLTFASFGWVGMCDAVLVVFHRYTTPGRAEDAALLFRYAAAYAVAAGLVGALIGSVIMLASMNIPTKLGPAVAIVLLTMLYGVLLSMICVVFSEYCGRKAARHEHHSRGPNLAAMALPIASLASAGGLLFVLISFGLVVWSIQA